MLRTTPTRLLLAGLLLIVTLLFAGCAGGEGPIFGGGDRDLTGLEGTWDAQLSLNGQLDGDPFSTSSNITFFITRNSIRDNDGDFWSYTYDGFTLRMSLAENNSIGFDPNCGEVRLSGTSTLNWSVRSGQRSASISGNVPNLRLTSNCGVETGNGNYNGFTNRR